VGRAAGSLAAAGAEGAISAPEQSGTATRLRQPPQEIRRRLAWQVGGDERLHFVRKSLVGVAIALLIATGYLAR